MSRFTRSGIACLLALLLFAGLSLGGVAGVAFGPTILVTRVFSMLWVGGERVFRVLYSRVGGPEVLSGSAACLGGSRRV